MIILYLQSCECIINFVPCQVSWKLNFFSPKTSTGNIKTNLRQSTSIKRMTELVSFVLIISLRNFFCQSQCSHDSKIDVPRFSCPRLS